MNAVLKEMPAETLETVLTQVYGKNGNLVADYIDPQIVVDPETIYGSITAKKGFGLNMDALDALKSAPSIGIYFAKATEGRPYSLAIRLREQGYTGELHAVGRLNQEVVHHLIRVGFTHFHLSQATGSRIDSAILAPFGAHYQQTFVEAKINA